MADHRGIPEEVRSDQDFFIYHHGDHLGSAHIMTEGKEESRHSGVVYRRGQIVQRFEYSPFGQETYALNPNLKFDPSYTGQIYDIESGLYYYKSRYYDPQLARFIQPDTVVPDAKNLQAYNRYTYVNNNPLKYVDPTGHFWGFFKKMLGAFVGAFVTAFVTAVLAPYLGPAAFLVGGMMGSVIGGAIGGGVNGIKGALMGFGLALTGPIGGGIRGGWKGFLMGIGQTGSMAFGGQALAIAAGAALSFATGGWQGLVMFGAGMAGAYAGKGIGDSIGGTERGGAPESNTAAEKLEQFEPGEGMGSYESSERQFGTRETIRSLRNIGKDWQTTGNTDDIMIGDISFEGGGPMPGHSTGHQYGRNVDVRLGNTIHGRSGVGDYKYSVVYSRTQTQAIVNTFRANPNVRVIYFNDPSVSGVSPLRGHDDHLHVEFYR